MKTTKSISKRLLTVLLVLTLVLSFAVPSMASTITIQPDSNTSTPTGETGNYTPETLVKRFKAYQIFKGDLDENYVGGTDGANSPYDNPKAGKLSNITWGNGVKADNASDIQALLNAFKADTTSLSKAGITATADELSAKDPYKSLFTRYNAIVNDPANHEGENLENPLLSDKQSEANEAKAADYAAIKLGDLFKAQLEASMYWDEATGAYKTGLSDATWKQSASIIAQVLTDFTSTSGNNAALAEAFAKILTKNGTDYDTYLRNKIESDWNGTNWTINTGDDQNGYYLIVDTHKETVEGGSSSDYIVGVFGNSTIKVKTGTTESEKKIKDGDRLLDGNGYNVGDEITFQLSGTLPENYGNYEKYVFNFIDTMSEGLTYLGGSENNLTDGTHKDVKFVYAAVLNETNGVLTIDGHKYDVYKIELNAETGYTTIVTENADSTTNTKLEVKFADLKKVKGVKATAYNAATGYTWAAAATEDLIPLTGGSKIFVEYTATLNEKSVKDTGETNKLKLEYSNDPKDQGNGKTGTTPEDTVYVYDFGIDLDKYDGSDNSAITGAGFAVKRTVNKNSANVTEYAILKKASDGNYVVAGWISENDLIGEGKVINKAKSALTDTDWKDIAGNLLADYLGEGFGSEESDKYDIAAMVNSTTGKLNIKGLDDGTYNLEEVIVPYGYDKAADITVTFSAAYFTEEELTADRAEGGAKKYPTEVKPGMLKDLTISYTVNGQSNSVQVAKDGYWLKKNAAGDNYERIVKTPAVTEGEPAPAVYYTTAEDIPAGAVQADLLAHLRVPNFPEGWLPGTGGMGTTLFYVAGGVLLAGAALYLIFVNMKKRSVAQEQ